MNFNFIDQVVKQLLKAVGYLLYPFQRIFDAASYGVQRFLLWFGIVVLTLTLFLLVNHYVGPMVKEWALLVVTVSFVAIPIIVLLGDHCCDLNLDGQEKVLTIVLLISTVWFILGLQA